MSRGLSLLALLLLTAVSFGLYQLSYEVQRLEDELIELNRALSQERETIGVLQAEWSYLTRPDAVQDRAERLLSMRPATVKDIVALEALPWRQDRGTPAPAPLVSALPQPAPASAPALAAAPAAAPPASASAPASAPAPAPAVQVAVGSVPAADFDAEVNAVLGAMQRSAREPRRAQ